MKSRSTIKSVNNSNSFLSSGPNIIHPMKLKRKILQQNDNFTELIRNFSKTSKQGNENLISLLSIRDEMINKISKMEGELIRNNDLISNERHQLQIFGGERLLNESNSEIESTEEKSQNYYQNYNSDSHLDEQTISKAIQNCIILNPFVDCFNDSIQKDFSEDNKKDIIKSNEQNSQIESPINSDSYPKFRQFFLILKSLDEVSYNNFMKASFSQLNWISECIEIYHKIQKYVESDLLIENFHNLTEQLFFANHDDVKLFIFDPKSEEYTTFDNDDDNYIQISFNSEQSILRSIIEKQSPEIVKSPPNHPSYSMHVDQLFNKFNQSFFGFPIEKNALVMIFRLEEPFNNEDFIIGQFFSNLIAPLFDIHVKSVFITKQIEQRRTIREFEANLSDKKTFKLLIPYLFSFISNEVEANDAKFFVVNDDELIEIEIEDDQIIQKKFPRSGVPEFIVEKKEFFMTEKLKSDSFENYDDRIDEWSVDTCLIGFPIFSDKAVIAVLLVSEKIGWNKFNQWDIEKLQTISNDISNVVQTCIKNDNLINVTSPHQNILLSFPTAVQSFTFEKIELNNSAETIMKTTQNLLNCEWLSIYSTINSKSSKIQKVATLHNGSFVDTEFLDLSFIKAAFSSKKAIHARDPLKKIEGFKTVGNVSPGDFLFSFCGEGKEKVVAFAMNTKSGDDGCKFNQLSSEILSSLCNFVRYSIKIKEQSNLIVDVKQLDTTISNAFNVCESITKDKEPFQKLIGVFKQLLSMESFVVLRFNKIKNVFEPVFNSDDCVPRRTVGRNDLLALQFDGLDGLFFINDFLKSEYESSDVASFFVSFKQLLIDKIDDKQCVVIVFAGRNVASNYKLLFQYFSPLLKVFYKTFVLNNEVKFIESDELNSINFYHSKFTDDELSSLSFDSASFSDSQKDEAVLLMFESLGLIKTIGTNIEQFATFLIKVRHSFCSEVPFHNYNHAVNSTQMMYIILKEINKNDDAKLQTSLSASLMLAALLHDVSHEGFDSNFLKKSFSPLVYAHGSEATLEHFHVSTAVSILREFLIMKNDNSLALFWPTFVNSILATNDDLNDRFVADLKSKNDIDWKSEDDLILLSKVLLRIADASRCFRPFETCRRSSESLFEEKKRQKEAANENKIEIEELKKIDVFEIEFIDSVVEPLVQFLCKIENKLTFLQEKMKSNRSSWSRYKNIK